MSDQALIRLEYKLDLVIRALQDKGLMLPILPDLSGIEEDCCPVCSDPNRLILDLKNESIHKACECTLPKSVVAGISSLLEPTESEEHYGRRARTEESRVPPDASPEGDGDGPG